MSAKTRCREWAICPPLPSWRTPTTSSCVCRPPECDLTAGCTRSAPADARPSRGPGLDGARLMVVYRQSKPLGFGRPRGRAFAEWGGDAASARRWGWGFNGGLLLSVQCFWSERGLECGAGGRNGDASESRGCAVSC